MLPLRLWSCKEHGQFLPMARSAHTDLSSFRKSGQLASITGRSKLSGIDLARKRRTCMTHCQLMSADVSWIRLYLSSKAVQELQRQRPDFWHY